MSASSRPRIEDNLGLTSDNDEEDVVEIEAPSESSDNSDTMDDTVIANRDKINWDFELGENEVCIYQAYCWRWEWSICIFNNYVAACGIEFIYIFIL